MPKKFPSSARRNPRESARRKPSNKVRLARRYRTLIRIGILALTGLGVFGVKKFFSKPEPQAQNQVQGESTTIPPLPNLVPETNAEWLNQIRLPEMGPITEGKINLMDRLPKNIDHAHLKEFLRQYRELRAEATKALEKEMDISVRERLILDFIASLNQAYKEAAGVNENEGLAIGEMKFKKRNQEINKLIMPFGEYMDVMVDLDLKVKVGFFNIKNTSHIFVNNKQNIVLNIGLGGSLLTVPEAEKPNLSGSYLHEIDITVISNAGTDKRFEELLAIQQNQMTEVGKSFRNLDNQKIIDDFRVSVVYHEAAHAFLQDFVSDPEKRDAIKKKGDIPMGYYSLPFGVFANEDNSKLHELFGNGIMLMLSGESAPLSAMHCALSDINIDKTYTLERKVFWNEISHSPELDSATRHKLESEMNGTDMVVAINRLPDESLRKIGERMAKLALYLTQNE